MSNIVTDFNSLYVAYRKTRRQKWHSPTALRYGLNALENTVSLGRSLDARTFRPSPTYTFRVYEPKERIVIANAFVDKVVQHSLCDNAMQPCFTPSFVRDNYASQVGKGTHDALDRLEGFMRHYYFSRKAAADKARREQGLAPLPAHEGGYHKGYVLKGDFSKYFYSILHEPLKEMARKKFRKRLPDADVAEFCDWLLCLFIDMTPDPGLPIGFQTSQLLALLNLDGLDHLVKDELGAKYYGRYMDDFYIIHEDKRQLEAWLARIEEFIEPLGLRLNQKTQIFPLAQGLDFLGFHSYLTPTGKVIRKIRDDSKNNMRRRLKKYRRLVDERRMTLRQVKASYESWKGHASHGDTHRLVQNTDALFYALFPELKPQQKGADANVKENEHSDRGQ